LIAGEGSRKAKEPSGKAGEVERIAPAPDPIGTVPRIWRPEVESIASVTKINAPLPDLMPPEIDLMGRATDWMASMTEDRSALPQVLATLRQNRSAFPFAIGRLP